MPGPDDPRSGGAAGILAGPDAPGAGTAGRAGMREGTLYRRDRRAGAGCPVRGGGAGAGCHDRGDGAGGGERAVQCLFCGRGCGSPAGLFFPGGGRPDLHQFLRPMALQQARPAAAHPRELLGAVPGGPAGRGTDPLQDGQPGAV